MYPLSMPATVLYLCVLYDMLQLPCYITITISLSFNLIRQDRSPTKERETYRHRRIGEANIESPAMNSEADGA